MTGVHARGAAIFAKAILSKAAAENCGPIARGFPAWNLCRDARSVKDASLPVRHTRHFLLRSGAAAALASLALAATPAHAQYATGGTGTHRSKILWLDWGTNGENVFAGKTITRTTYVDTPNTPANRLDITCSVQNAAATRGATGLFVYAPGDWQGDGLDDLYNIGGNDPGDGVGVGGNPNTLTTGLRTSNAATVEFDLNCSATLGGNTFPLSGLVFAEAEASGTAGGVTEYVAARLTSGGVLRVIDQISQCGAFSPVTVTGSEYRFNGTATHCQSNATPLLRAGPALVGFIDGATSARIIAQGRGVSAVAVGAVIELEFSEGIPNTYGNASHVLDSTWTGGLASAGVNFNNPANLATPVYQLWLGATVQPDADANGVIGGSDTDALAKKTGVAGAGYADVASPQGPAGTAYTINTVSCFGPGAVAGWIDFNGNGVFDSGEKSTVQTCGTGASSVNLTWTVPAGGTTPQATSFMRIRAATSAADLANAAGVASNGEAEDYRITVGGAKLRLQKTWADGVAGDSATLQATGLSNGVTLSASTVTGSDSQQSAYSNVYVGETATFSETLTAGNAGFYTGVLNCTGAADTDLSDGLTIAAADTEITCTFTNTRRVIATDADSVTGVNGATGANDVLNVLDGDTFNGAAAALTAVDLSVVTPATPLTAGAPVPVLGTNGLVDVPAGTPAGTYTIDYKICDKLNPTNCSTNTATITVAPSIDLEVTKTDGKTDVFPGDTVTYTLTVKNNGPDAATGAIVTDSFSAGLTCPATNAVTITGNGVPVGGFTIANLTGAGITLGSLASGQSAVLTYSCTVN